MILSLLIDDLSERMPSTAFSFDSIDHFGNNSTSMGIAMTEESGAHLLVHNLLSCRDQLTKSYVVNSVINIHSPLCRGGKPCELCHLRASWILDIKQMKSGPRGRLRRLNSICDHLLQQKPPKIEFKPKVHEDHSIVGQIGEAFDTVLGFFGFGKKAAEKKAQEAQARVDEIKKRQGRFASAAL